MPNATAARFQFDRNFAAGRAVCERPHFPFARRAGFASIGLRF
jgi:hypothetical protein